MILHQTNLNYNFSKNSNSFCFQVNGDNYKLEKSEDFEGDFTLSKKNENNKFEYTTTDSLKHLTETYLIEYLKCDESIIHSIKLWISISKYNFCSFDTMIYCLIPTEHYIHIDCIAYDNLYGIRLDIETNLLTISCFESGIKYIINIENYNKAKPSLKHINDFVLDTIDKWLKVSFLQAKVK